MRVLGKSNERLTPYEHDDHGEDLFPRRVCRDVAEADGGERGAVNQFHKRYGNSSKKLDSFVNKVCYFLFIIQSSFLVVLQGVMKTDTKSSRGQSRRPRSVERNHRGARSFVWPGCSASLK